eukprot:5671741-Pyramimonas_sp.AAC.1
MALTEMLYQSIESCDQTIAGIEAAISELKSNLAREQLQRARMNHLLNTVRSEIATASSE